MDRRHDTGMVVTRPLYSYSETDYLAGVSPGTAKRWLEGYWYWTPDGERIVQPPVTIRPRPEDGASFLDLVEVTAIGRLKEAGFPLRRIREIVTNCQHLLGVEHPLVTLQFKTDGREIFVDQGEQLLEVGKRKGEQAWSEFLAPFLHDIEYEADFARRWYPQGQGRAVVVDPDYGYGLPVVVGTGVRTEIILERFQVGETIREIAQDFNLAPNQVEQALQFETRLAKRAA
jgi:uncharacterized protein (DUF433 family)